MNKRNEGFTLIEMLVVIAMIGLLSAVVLVALGPSRNKAKDTRIISDLQQIRSVMETLYNPTTNSYTITPVTSCSTPASGNSNIDTAFKDINTNNGSACALNLVPTTSNGYAVSATTASGASYCVDSTGKVASSTAASGVCQ